MSRIICRAIIFLLIILKVSMAEADDPYSKFLPKPVPINLKPPSYDETYMGFGYNQITATSEWNDSWLTGDEENVGELKYTVKNLVVGIVKSRTLLRQNRIDWNYALSLHAAYFYTDGSFEALSDDRQYGESYDEESSFQELHVLYAIPTDFNIF